jgi:hypothetical protein
VRRVGLVVSAAVLVLSIGGFGGGAELAKGWVWTVWGAFRRRRLMRGGPCACWWQFLMREGSYAWRSSVRFCEGALWLNVSAPGAAVAVLSDIRGRVFVPV